MAREIAGNLSPYLFAAVADEEQAPLFKHPDSHALVERIDNGIRLSYVTEDIGIEYAGLHEFTFDFDGRVSYFLTPGVDAELPVPLYLNDIEAIGRHEAALFELAFISKVL